MANKTITLNLIQEYIKNRQQVYITNDRATVSAWVGRCIDNAKQLSEQAYGGDNSWLEFCDMLNSIYAHNSLANGVDDLTLPTDPSIACGVFVLLGFVIDIENNPEPIYGTDEDEQPVSDAVEPYIDGQY